MSIISKLTRNNNNQKKDFLQQLEHYSSLLFLTTNRERELDPAIHSRIHLTVNYPALDLQSRRTIWCNFVRQGAAAPSSVTEEELDVLARLDVNGRRIRNVVKTARLMARRGERDVTFVDIRQVIRITEGISLD